MVTIKQYADSRGVSREAVRKQIVRYQDQLERHISIQNRTKYLDEYAVDFLDNHRMQRTVVVKPSDKETEEEINRLRAELDKARGEILKKSDAIIQLQEDKMSLLEIKGKYEALIEDKQATQDRLTRYEEELSEVRSKLDETQRELSSFGSGFLGFYRKHTKKPPEIASD